MMENRDEQSYRSGLFEASFFPIEMLQSMYSAHVERVSSSLIMFLGTKDKLIMHEAT